MVIPRDPKGTTANNLASPVKSCPPNIYHTTHRRMRSTFMPCQPATVKLSYCVVLFSQATVLADYLYSTLQGVY